MNRYTAWVLTTVLCMCKTSQYVDAFTPASLGKSSFCSSMDQQRIIENYLLVKRSTQLCMVGGGGSFFRPIPQNRDDDDDDDNDDEEEEEEDPYTQAASSEFEEDSSKLALSKTSVDWGGAYGKLRQRFEDVETGKTGPSNTLFRIMSKETPNEAISNFVKEANPEVVAAMSGAISSLLGGLSNPVMGVETIVKANREKLGNLCFQLQMTGYVL